MNTPLETEVVTLDLDPARPTETKYGLEMGNITGLPFGVGEFYRGTEFEHKIRQPFGDSARFDFAPYHLNLSKSKRVFQIIGTRFTVSIER